MHEGFSCGRSRRSFVARLITICTLLVSASLSAKAQSAATPDTPPSADQDVRATLELPDAPSAVLATSSSSADQDIPPARDTSSSAGATVATLPEASRTQRYPKPGQTAPILTPGDKFHIALRGAVSPYAAFGWLSAAGYEHLTNTSPNWGTDRGAFGQRLGDAALRASSEDFLSDGVMASLFHQDPRYYRLGPGHNVLARAAYAATRPIITRTDHGRTMPNFALMVGNLSGSAITNAYYPQQNRGFEQTLQTFGSGLAGSAIGDGIIEFFGTILVDHHFHGSH